MIKKTNEQWRLKHNPNPTAEELREGPVFTGYVRDWDRTADPRANAQASAQRSKGGRPATPKEKEQPALENHIAAAQSNSAARNPQGRPITLTFICPTCNKVFESEWFFSRPTTDELKAERERVLSGHNCAVKARRQPWGL